MGAPQSKAPSEWRRMKYVIPGFCPIHFPFRSQGDQLTAKGVWYVSIFGIQVKSVDAPSFPIPVGKGGDFFFSFFSQVAAA